MKKIDNEKGFIVYETYCIEIAKIGGLGICDFCNDFAPKWFLIPVISSYYCPKCYSRFCKESRYYEEDREIENRHAEYYEEAIGLDD